MLRITFLLAILSTLIVCTPSKLSVEQKTAYKHWKSDCSSCHGQTPELFADRQWKMGASRLEIIKSIRQGHKDAAFSTAYSDKEVLDLADLLVEGQVKAKEKALGAPPVSNVFAAASMTVTLDTVIGSGLDNPWGIAFLPSGDMLVTDRGGELYRYNEQDDKLHRIGGVPPVLAEGQGGLLDVKLHPNFKQNGLVYLSYSKFKSTGTETLSTTAVFRGRLVGDSILGGQDIFVAEPWYTTRHHYGSRMAFDAKGFLYVSVGDRGNEKFTSPNLRSDCGKIHRLTSEGLMPVDNPFVKVDTARMSIYSYGHRNPQGLAIHPTTGVIWEHEHGPRGGDEINIIEPGKNYGWPEVSFGTKYSGDDYTNIFERPDVKQPVSYYMPSIGPCGMAFVLGTDRYPTWKGDLMVGSLRFQYMDRCKVEGNTVKDHELLLKRIGRMRCIVVGPDGYLYVATEGPGRVYRLK